MAIRKARKKSRRKASARRRKNPARKRRMSAKRRRKNPAKSRQRRSAAQKRASLANLKKAHAKRKGAKRKSSTSTKRKGKRRSGSVGMKLAKKTRRNVKRVRKSGTKKAKAYATRYKMTSNPGAMMDAVKQVLPIAASFYGTKFVSAKLASVGPVSGMLAKLPMGGKLAGPVMSGVVLAGVHYGTKKGALKKHRTGMMLGAAFALVDSAFSAFAPASVASQFGVAAVGEYFPMSEYVAQSEYVPQSDYVAMSDYESTDQSPRQLHEVWGVHGIEEELGSDYGSLQSAW